MTEEMLQKKTLKDIDFKFYEQYVNIDPQTAVFVAQILTNDVKFLCGMEWMDYSLLIVKVDWKKFI